MIKIENVEVFNVKNAIRGLRNPMNSWHLSDSTISSDGEFVVGSRDIDLCKRMIRGGSPNRKFLRQIFVSIDITAPLYWWSEMDTYKVGTTANSCSTMHKLLSRELTLDDFSHDDMTDEAVASIETAIKSVNNIIASSKLEENKSKNTYLLRSAKAILPSSYLQKRTWTADYEVLLGIIRWRTFHRLPEWREFCKNIRQVCPYLDEFAKTAFENTNLKDID